MRWLVYTLLLANLLFYGATHWLAQSVPAAAPALPQLQLVAAPALAAPPHAPAATRCRSLGPLTDGAMLAALAGALHARGLEPVERSAQVTLDGGYAVRATLPAPGSARARLLRRLAQAGVHEAADAQDAGAQLLALGTYAAREGAEQRATLARGAGADVRVEPVTRIVSGQWLDVQLPADFVAPAPATLAAGLALPATTTWSDCPAPASAPTAAQDAAPHDDARGVNRP